MSMEVVTLKTDAAETVDIEKLNERIDVSVACCPVTELEMEAARNTVRQSSHTHIRILPNHHINKHGNLSGFVFTCSEEDKASVLPVSPEMFATTCVYECNSNAESLSPDCLRIFGDIERYKVSLREVLDGLRDAENPANFDCIPENDSNEAATHARIVDEREWTEALPVKAGVYHSFVRSIGKDNRDHRIFIVVSGCLQQAAEQLQNLWYDVGKHITCRTFHDSSEVQWLRKATIRNHSRIAARIAEKFKLSVNVVADTESPTRVRMLVPINVTRLYDMHVDRGRMRLTDHACFLDKTPNGITFDMFASEGFWVFLGPPDNTTYNSFGGIFKATMSERAFPSKTVRYHAQYPCKDRRSVVRVQSAGKTFTTIGSRETQEFFFPNEDFYKALEQLGYDRNHGVHTLMPIVCCVSVG